MRGVAVAALFVLVAFAGCAASGDNPSASSSQDPGVSVSATQDTGVIRGLVVDPAIKPIANATVTLSPGALKTKTNANGGFGFQGLKPGTYFVAASKLGYQTAQSSAEVVAGVSEPPITKVQLAELASTKPYFRDLSFQGYLSLGAAVVATSVGSSTYPPLGASMGDNVYFTIHPEIQPQWMQGELFWDQTQPAGGQMIWEAVVAGNNNPVGYRETTTSPALAYWDNKTIEANKASVMDPKVGTTFRIFGGPHPLCRTEPYVNTFGCGLTVQQKLQGIIHTFYNFQPPKGWRFSKDGAPKVPQ